MMTKIKQSRKNQGARERGSYGLSLFRGSRRAGSKLTLFWIVDAGGEWGRC